MKTIKENDDTDTEEMEVESPPDVDQSDANNTKEHATFQASIKWRSESPGTANG